MSFLSLFQANSNTSALSAEASSLAPAGNLSAIASGVSYALRGSALEPSSPTSFGLTSLLSAGISWVKSWLGVAPLPDATESFYQTAFDTPEITGGPALSSTPEEPSEEPAQAHSETRTLQAALPTQIPVNQPTTFTLSRLQADAINGNGTYANVTSTLLDGKALPNGTAIETPWIDLKTLTLGSGFRILTPFNPDGFAVAGKTSTTSDTFYIIDKDLNVMGNGTFGLNFTGFTSIRRQYLLENQDLFIYYSGQKGSYPNYVYLSQIQQFSINKIQQTLIINGIYQTPGFSISNTIRQIGDPILDFPKTMFLNLNVSMTTLYGPSSIAEWGMNANSSTIEIKNLYPLTPGYGQVAKSLNNSIWLSIGVMSYPTGGISTELYILKRYDNKSFEITKTLTVDTFSSFALAPEAFYLQSGTSSSSSICRYTYEGERLNCGTGNLLSNIYNNNLHLLNSGSLQTLDPITLAQTSQLAFPGVASVDAAFPDKGFIAFSADGSIYKAENHPSTAAFGYAWTMTLPAYIAYGMTPGTTHAITVNFTSGGNSSASTFTQSFIPVASTPLPDPACSFAFTNPLGTPFSFNISSLCIQDADSRTWTSTGVALPNYGFSAVLQNSQVSIFNISNVDLSTLRVNKLTPLNSRFLALTTQSNTSPINLRIVDSLQETGSLNIAPADQQFLTFSNSYFQDTLCLNGITLTRDGYQQNITTFCANSSNPLSLSPIASAVLPMGNRNGTEYLTASFQTYPITQDLIGFYTFKSASPQKYYWAFYNISDPRTPQLVYANDTYPFSTPANTITRSKFNNPTPFKDTVFLNELGHVFEWESPFNLLDPRWVTRAQLPVPSTQSAIYDPYTIFDENFVAYVTNTGRINIWDLAEPSNPRLSADFGSTIQFAALALTEDQQTLAAIDVTHKVSIFSVVRLSDDTFGFSLLAEVQTPLTSTNTKLYWPPHHRNELWKIPLGQNPGTTLYRITPPNGDWHPQYTVSGVVNSLQTQTLNLAFSDGLGRQLNLPFSVTGTPLPVVANSTDLVVLGDQSYAYTLGFNGSRVFSPGAPTPTFDIDLNPLFTSPNQAYIPGTSLRFFFEEASLPSFVTIFDRGNGRYSLQIVGGIFPAQAVNLRPDGSLIENTQPMIIQVGDTLGSSGIDLHLKIQIQGHTPAMKKAFQMKGLRGDIVTTTLPETVTGENSHGFLANTDGLDPCYESRNTPSWIAVECFDASAEVPLNSVGTTVFQVRPRTFIPGTGQLVGVGEWQNATFINAGQAFSRPLGELFPLGSAPRVKIGVPFSLMLNHPSAVIFRNADGNYSAIFSFALTGASRVESYFSAETGVWNGVILSPTNGLTARLTATQPAVYPSPETASQVASVFVEPSLAVTLPQATAFTEGVSKNMTLEIATPSRAETLDITLQWAPLTGSAARTVITLPSPFLPYINTQAPIAGRLSLQGLPTSLLSRLNQTAGMTTYELPVVVNLAEGQNVYWTLEVDAQDYASAQPLNAETHLSTTLLVQEKPRAAEVDVEAALLSTDTLTLGTRTQIRMDGLFVNSPGGAVTYALRSSQPAVVEILPRRPESVFATIMAREAGEALLTACLTNRFNLETCTTPQRVTVPGASNTPLSAKDSSTFWPSMGTIIGFVGVTFGVVVLVGPILHSYKKQGRQAQALIDSNQQNLPLRREFLKDVIVTATLPKEVSDALSALLKRETLAEPTQFKGLLMLAFRGSLKIQYSSPNPTDPAIRLRAAITHLKDSIVISPRENNADSVEQLMALLTFTTLLAATRHSNFGPTPYDWRLAFLRWIDDQVSLIQGSQPTDNHVKALFKLIRHTIQPLKTNETAFHYFLRHLTSVPGMIFRYFKSRKDQGDTRETEKTIHGLLALFSSTQYPKLAKDTAISLQKEKDWRLKVLAMMILNELGDRRLDIELQRGEPTAPKTGCFSCPRRKRPKSTRHLEIARAFSLTPRSAAGDSPDAKDSAGRGAGIVSGVGVGLPGHPLWDSPATPKASIQNPLRNVNPLSREARVTGTLRRPPPPPLPLGPPPG
jgi:hypothetical protein